MLVDARLDSEAGLLSPLAAQADELVVVLRPQVEGHHRRLCLHQVAAAGAFAEAHARAG